MNTTVEEVPAPRPESPDWVVLSEYNPPTGTPCPAAIRFWDGSERKLEYWYEILTFVVEKLYTEGRLTDENIPVPSGSKRHIVHTKSVHPTGEPFTSRKSIDGTPLFVDVHLNAPAIRQNSQNLLQSFGPNPVAVYLQAAK